jgi:hypothetical protein
MHPATSSRSRLARILGPGVERRCRSCAESLPYHLSRCFRCGTSWPRLRYRLIWQAPLLVAAGYTALSSLWETLQ